MTTTSQPGATSPGPSELAGLAARHGLPRLGGRPRLGAYLRELQERRHFTIELARARFAAERSHDRLGLAWVVIKPLMNAAVYFLVFGVILTLNNKPANYPAFLLTGIFVFQYFSQSLTTNAKSITGNVGLVRALHFPRAMLPISTQLQQAFTLLPILSVLAVLVLATGETPSWRWLLAVPAVFLESVFCLGVGFLAARATVAARDVTQLLPFVTRLLFYISGIFYDVQRQTPAKPWVKDVMQQNPVHIFLSLVRGAFLEDHPAPSWMWFAAAAWALGALLIGFLFFWRAEESYGRS